MTRTRNAFIVPLWIALVAVALLALVLRAQPVLAPADMIRPAVVSVQPQSSPTAHAAASRTITASPIAAPAAPHQVAGSEPPASQPAQCPAQSGSGLPCQLP